MNSPKRLFYILGVITLFIFPIPAIWALNYFENISLQELLELDKFNGIWTLLGLEFGLFYGIIVLAFAASDLVSESGHRQQRLINDMNLGWIDIVFISICAGIGEELLFRVGIQHWLGPWVTSIIFIAIHGYLNPFKLKDSLYGLFILPFILALSFGYKHYGLWFAIAAHFSFDLLLFRVYAFNKKTI